MTKTVLAFVFAGALASLVGCSDSAKKPLSDTEVIPPPPGMKMPKLDKPGMPGQPVAPSTPTPKKGAD